MSLSIAQTLMQENQPVATASQPYGVTYWLTETDLVIKVEGDSGEVILHNSSAYIDDEIYEDINEATHLSLMGRIGINYQMDVATKELTHQVGNFTHTVSGDKSKMTYRFINGDITTELRCFFEIGEFIVVTQPNTGYEAKTTYRIGVDGFTQTEYFKLLCSLSNNNLH